jgi:hypothetical protein
MDLFRELQFVVSHLIAERIPYALCGGLAMSVYAFHRATLALDFMIDPKDLDKVRSIASELGFDIDAGLMNFADGKVRIHRMTKIDEATGDALPLDFLLVTDELKDVWESSAEVEWDRGRLSVVSPEGLIKLKSLRMSGQDRDDIARLRSLLDEN